MAKKKQSIKYLADCSLKGSKLKAEKLVELIEEMESFKRSDIEENIPIVRKLIGLLLKDVEKFHMYATMARIKMAQKKKVSKK